MDAAHAVGYVIGLFIANALPLFAATLVISVGKRGFMPILTATVLGTVVSWICLFVMGNSSVAGLVGLFAMAGVYSEVLDTRFAKAIGLAVIVGLFQLMMSIYLHHGTAAQASAGLFTAHLPAA